MRKIVALFYGLIIGLALGSPASASSQQAFTKDELEGHIYDFCTGHLGSNADLESCGKAIGSCKNSLRSCLEAQCAHDPSTDVFTCSDQNLNNCEEPGSTGDTAKQAIQCEEGGTAPDDNGGDGPCVGDCIDPDQPSRPDQPTQPDQPGVGIEKQGNTPLDTGTTVVAATPGSLFEGSGCSLQVLGHSSGPGLWPLLLLAIPALGRRRK